MPALPLVIDTARMAELRAAQAEDISAIVAIDPHSPGRPGQIQALVCEQASLVAVEHGQIVGWLRYERMAEMPQTLYGQGIKSNYQGQSLKLAKQFRAPG